MNVAMMSEILILISKHLWNLRWQMINMVQRFDPI